MVGNSQWRGENKRGIQLSLGTLGKGKAPRTTAAAEEKCRLLSASLGNSQTGVGHQLALFWAQQGLNVNRETFLPNQKHKHETWKLQDYKAGCCWLFTHLMWLQHILLSRTEPRSQTGDTEQSLTKDLNSLVILVWTWSNVWTVLLIIYCAWKLALRLDWLPLSGVKLVGCFQF